MLNMDSNHKDTEKCLKLQIDPGVRVWIEILLTKPNPIQVDCYNREVAAILRLPFRRICTAPLIFVHGVEYSPFWMVLQSFRDCRSIEALFQRRNVCLSGKLIVSFVCSQCSISTPVADHDSIVAESKLIQPVNDNLCESRQEVGFFACYHNCIGIKLNIDNDGVSIILLQVGLQSYQILMKSVIDNGTNDPQESQILQVTKCQYINFSNLAKRSGKDYDNHASNHDKDFVISALSNHYKWCFCVANHVANHDTLKMTSFCTQVTTITSTIQVRIICVISNTYSSPKNIANHASNHDRLIMSGCKMKATTQVTTIRCMLIIGNTIYYRRSNLSANHVANHDGLPKLPSEMTYSSILLYIEIIIIILYRGVIRARAYAYARVSQIGK